MHKIPPYQTTLKTPLACDINGNLYSRNEILAMRIVRWSKGKKLLIVSAINSEVVTKDEVLATFRIGLEELQSWIDGFKKAGLNGLSMRTLVNERTRSGN